MKLQKIAGIASLLNTILIVIFLVILLLVFPRLGLVGAWDDTAKVLDAMNTSPISFFTLSLGVIFCCIPFVFIVLGIKERMQDSASNLMQVLIVAVSANCALWFAAGSIGIFAWPSIVHNGDLSASSIANAMNQSLIFAGDSAAGWVILLIGWAGLKTGRLPKALSYLAVVKAIFMILEIAVAPFTTSIIGLLLGIPFYPWLGIVLLRTKN